MVPSLKGKACFTETVCGCIGVGFDEQIPVAQIGLLVDPARAASRAGDPVVAKFFCLFLRLDPVELRSSKTRPPNSGMLNQWLLGSRWLPSHSIGMPASVILDWSVLISIP